jgi:hypothetical protein
LDGISPAQLDSAKAFFLFDYEAVDGIFDLAGGRKLL